MHLDEGARGFFVDPEPARLLGETMESWLVTYKEREGATCAAAEMAIGSSDVTGFTCFIMADILSSRFLYSAYHPEMRAVLMAGTRNG